MIWISIKVLKSHDTGKTITDDDDSGNPFQCRRLWTEAPKKAFGKKKLDKAHDARDRDSQLLVKGAT
jgi:hypothetical protein